MSKRANSTTLGSTCWVLPWVLPALQIGLAPAMGASHQDTFWGAPQPENAALDTMWKLGRCNPHELDSSHQALALINHCWVDETCHTKHPPMHIHHHVLSARQLFARASGHIHEDFELPPINTIEGAAPDEPNVYADGSASLPNTLQWSTAVIGIFYPERNQPYTQIEDDLMTCGFAKDGKYEAYAAVSGPNAASTRAELGAMLGASLAPFPIHVAMDNISVVNRTQLLIRGIPIHPYKPWQLLRDGHLWKALSDAIYQRGPGSIAASWVKGRAKAIHIQKGITTLYHKLRNDRVDTIADDGQENAHPLGLRRLWQLYGVAAKRDLW